MTSISELYATAQQHHRTGDLQRAEALYRQILQTDPLHPQALHFLGLIAHQVGRHDIAVDYMRRSIALMPLNEEFHCNLGMAYWALGQLDAAAASYREAARLRPDRADMHFMLGNLLMAQGNSGEAADSYRRAIELNPDFGPAHNNLGNLLLDQNKHLEAARHYQEALRLKPRHVAALCNLGNALHRLGRLDEAAANFLQALQLKPDCAEAHQHLGAVFQAQGRLDEAVACYREALRLVPGSVLAYNNLGNTLGLQGQWQQAVACYQEALRLQPDCAEAYYNLGAAQAMHGQLDEAAASFRQAIRIEPQMSAAHTALGLMLSDQQGLAGEAIACLEQAQRLQPSDRLRVILATRLPAIYQSVTDMETWRNRLATQVHQLRQRGVVLDLAAEPAIYTYYLAYQGRNDQDIQRELAALQRAPLERDEGRGMRDESKPCLPHPSSLIPHPSSLKIKIGFVSAFFRDHTIGHLWRGLVAQLSRDEFAVTVLALGHPQDEIAGLFRKHADRYLHVPTHLPSARRLIAEQQLDVLIYADIGMEPIATTLAYSRLAPVQCVSWGHPMTTGIDTIDYFLSADDLETGESEQHYTERLIRLPTLPIYYYRPELPAPLKERQHFGLAGDSHVYACPQTLVKFHPEFDQILGGILRGDPRAVLVLIKPNRLLWDELLRQRFAITLPDGGERIRFLPWLERGDFINLMAISDVLLDPLHFGGGNTSYEGLAVGTPIVTLPSNFLRGRITYALYKQMNMLDCVVHNPEDYVKLALRLGNDAGFRSGMRNKILAANAVLYENSQGIRELEQFLSRLRLSNSH